MKKPRPLDRLDHRLATQRLRARHVRAVGRALAARGAATGGLTCEGVWVRKSRVHFSESATSPGEAAADVAALAHDLCAHGAPRRAAQLAAAYAFAADDYGVYRRLAAAPGEAQVIAIGGLVASGKSTVARAVARRLAAPRVVADRVRTALLDHSGDAAHHELAWAAELSDRVYAGLLERAAEVLAGGRSVVLDACFASAARRDAAAELAAQHGARFVFAHCAAPEEDIVARLGLRDVRDGVAAGSWTKIARAVEAQWEAPRPGQHIHLDTSLPRASWLRALGLAKKERP